jgi:hypothetical protein
MYCAIYAGARDLLTIRKTNTAGACWLQLYLFRVMIYYVKAKGDENEDGNISITTSRRRPGSGQNGIKRAATKYCSAAQVSSVGC